MENDTEFVTTAEFMFPSHANKLELYRILLLLEQFARPSLWFQFYLSFFGILLTIFHLYILTRKAMMISSIIAIMIGIAICDVVAMLAAILTVNIYFDEEGTDWWVRLRRRLRLEHRPKINGQT